MSFTHEHEALLYLSTLSGMSFSRLQKLLTVFGSARAIFSASCSELNLYLPESLVQAIQHPDTNLLQTWLLWAEKPAQEIVTYWDERYPPLLKQISDPPLVLFVRGEVAVLKKHQIAIVGSRNPSWSGERIAFRFAGELAACGAVVTSGLAVGIDGKAHEGALHCGGKTIAVLGGGLDRLHPKQHTRLASLIAENGAVISEYPPETKPETYYFPQRNRIISGLSLGVLVVEAHEKSGSLITARCAVTQNREVFAVPGTISHPLSRGCHRLIREGAKLVEDIRDICEELPNYFVLPIREEKKNEMSVEPMSKEAKQLIKRMGGERVTIDTVVQMMGWSIAEAMQVLSTLEISGIVYAELGGYKLTSP